MQQERTSENRNESLVNADGRPKGVGHQSVEFTAGDDVECGLDD